MRLRRLRMIGGLTVVVVLLAPILGAPADPPRQPIAMLGDQPIYEEDLLPLAGAELLQLDNQKHDLRMKALQDLVKQRLLEREARSEGLSIEAFLVETVDRTVPPPTAAEIETYYLAHPDVMTRPLHEVRSRLELVIAKAKKDGARKRYLDQLQRKVGLSLLWSRPRAEIGVDRTRIRGNPEAPVTIVEFADFQCPECSQVQPALARVMDKYKGKVRLGFRDFPLRKIHAEAQQAAEAARCAGEQGRFWEYHDLLFNPAARLDPYSLREYARTAAMDVDRFGACLVSEKFAASIESDVQSGLRSGVSATPTFYINGRVLVGIQRAGAFESIVESELAASAARPY